MILFDLKGLVGAVGGGVIAGSIVYLVQHFEFADDNGTTAIFAGIGYCFLTSVYAFTFDRCDVQGIRAFEVNCKNFYYSAWANTGADWAADPKRTGITLSPNRRLCVFALPLASNVFFPPVLSVLAWIRDAIVEEPWATNTQHAVVFIVSVIALVVALFYARATRTLRIIPPLKTSPW